MVRGSAKLRFNCYLLRGGLQDPTAALRPPYRRGAPNEMVQLRALPSAPSGAEAFFGLGEERVPSWAYRLSGHFEGLDEIRSQSKRMVIFLPVEGRHFAICFGYGSNALDWSAVESNFGLRVAARLISPQAMKEVRSLRLDGGARTQQVQVSRETDIRDLDVTLDGEFVSRLVGRVLGGDEGQERATIEYSGALIAGDSIAFSAEVDLHDVANTLGHFLRVLGDGSQPEFAFVDALDPLRSREDPVPDLEAVLARDLFGDQFVSRRTESDTAIGSRPTFEVALSALVPPDSLESADVAEMLVTRNRRELVVPVLDVDTLKIALGEWKTRYSESDLRDTRAQALDFNGQPIGPSRALLNWLVFEVRSNVGRYILTFGRWFRLDANFYHGVDRDLSNFPDLTSVLGLPSWSASRTSLSGQPIHHESDYNSLLSCPNWLVCDHGAPHMASQKLRTDEGDEVEACDLFHRDGYLVHVKKWTGSATASHLLSQGEVSCEVLRGDSAYKQEFVDLATSCCPAHAKAARSAPGQVVFAFGAKPGVQIPLGLPTFTKVNLRNRGRRIKAITGKYPATARIDMV